MHSMALHWSKSVLAITLLMVLSVVLLFGAADIVQTQDDIENKVQTLLAKMTLEEKLGQLQMLDGEADGRFRSEHPDLIRRGLLGSTLNVRGAKRTNELQKVAMESSRLKIPVLFAFDVIHGYRTVFPVPLGEAASWDPRSAERAASIAAAEAAAAGLRWTFAPMVDIARDARWGRIVEGAGEDPYLGAAFAAARVIGFQGPPDKAYREADKLVACAKHWVGYGAAEGGRDYNSTEISVNTLRNIYFPPFKAALEAGVGTFMSAFNDLNAVPTSANPFTLRSVLRNEWKFDGIVVSDYTSIEELINHGLAASGADAARLALSAGVNVEMVSRLYRRHLPEFIKQNTIPTASIDEAVRNVLRIKLRLGLFERPYTDEQREQNVILSQSHIAAAREIAAKSLVLLKNEGDLLPLKKDIGSIGVIGPLADDQINLMGSWTGDGRKEDVVTLLAAVKAKLPAAKVLHAKGCGIDGDVTDGFEEAIRIAREADALIVAIGESAEMSGEAAVRTSLDLPGRQLDLVKALLAVNKPLVAVLMNGRPLSINFIAQRVPAILETWYAGTQGGHAIADVLFGDVNPGGKLPVTFPATVGQVPIYYNHKNTGRPPNASNKYTSKYLDAPWTPLYPFGFGLSYTKFRLSDLRLSATRIRPDGRLTASIDVQNIGGRTGDEVVQLYIRDVASSTTRPVLELKGFERVTLKPSERRRVEFELSSKHLGFWNREDRFVVEQGAFKIRIGTSSVDPNALETNLEVVE
jgi:beta-glucosidase